jgi:hypothetical protein
MVFPMLVYVPGPNAVVVEMMRILFCVEVYVVFWQHRYSGIHTLIMVSSYQDM